jgi:hypothetical protein
LNLQQMVEKYYQLDKNAILLRGRMNKDSEARSLLLLRSGHYIIPLQNRTLSWDMPSCSFACDPQREEDRRDEPQGEGVVGYVAKAIKQERPLRLLTHRAEFA